MARRFLDLLAEKELPLWSDQDHNRLLGYFYTEVGDLNQVIAYRAYRSWDERNEVVQAMRSRPELAEIGRDLGEMTVSMHNQLMLPAPFFRVPSI